jgi:hypothetical protein
MNGTMKEKGRSFGSVSTWFAGDGQRYPGAINAPGS